ncbi:MAG: sugar transferase [Bacteroidales bacterium]|nr:sugar transferase [Bacteroidales bacterium]
MLCFAARKVRKPVYDENPTYGPLVKLRRFGKNKKIIEVYKMRTMHPFSEYIQDYVLKHNGYAENGKPAGDFRLTSWGKFLRKYWLDESPQLLNVLKGEMKIVGVRPLSKRFLEEYPEDVKELRFKHKPGCFPPYVALLKQEVSEYIESERTYLEEKIKHPYTTDIKYFSKSVYNILTNKIRSS